MWVNHKSEGFGIHQWPNGEKHCGFFKNDCRHGEGSHTWPSGKKLVGRWENDVKRGPFTYTSAGGIVEYLYYHSDDDYDVEERTEGASETAMSDIEGDDAGGALGGDEVM